MAGLGPSLIFLATPAAAVMSFNAVRMPTERMLGIPALIISGAAAIIAVAYLALR